jgi:hypothetical protein
LKLVELFVRLQESVLHHVFGVFAVLRNVLRNPEDLPLVLADKRVIRGHIAGADLGYQGHIGMLLVLTRYWLDG